MSSKVSRSSPWLGWLLRGICVTNDHGYVPFAVITIHSYPHSVTYHRGCNMSSTTGVTCVAETANPPGAHELTPVCSGVRIARSLVFCAIFYGSFALLFLGIVFFLSFLLFLITLWYVQSLPCSTSSPKQNTFKCSFLHCRNVDFG